MTDTQRTQINCNIETNTNQVTPYSRENIESSYEKRRVSQEQLQHEYNYFLAQQLLESMLRKDLITVDEFNRITTLNRKSFSPALAQIMPRNP